MFSTEDRIEGNVVASCFLDVTNARTVLRAWNIMKLLTCMDDDREVSYLVNLDFDSSFIH